MQRSLHPTNDAKRLVLAQTAVTTASSDEDAGRPRLSQQTQDDLAARVPQFEEARRRMVQAKAERSQAVAGARTAVKALEAQMRQVWSTVRWRVRWDGASPAVLTYYGLSQDGARPSPRSLAAWLEVAEQILAGDAEAVAAGFATAVEGEALQTAHESAQTALDALSTVKQELRLAQKTLRGLRRQVAAR